jgi:4a-hydroxytetrahydrobiopterin dehydratase
LLSATAIAHALDQMPGWTGDTSALRCSIEFADFPSAIRAVVAVAQDAEGMNHHPDIDIRWRTVTFILSTHSAGGVTDMDLELAHKIRAVTA